MLYFCQTPNKYHDWKKYILYYLCQIWSWIMSEVVACWKMFSIFIILHFILTNLYKLIKKINKRRFLYADFQKNSYYSDFVITCSLRFIFIAHNMQDLKMFSKLKTIFNFLIVYKFEINITFWLVPSTGTMAEWLRRSACMQEAASSSLAGLSLFIKNSASTHAHTLWRNTSHTMT